MKQFFGKVLKKNLILRCDFFSRDKETALIKTPRLEFTFES